VAVRLEDSLFVVVPDASPMNAVGVEASRYVLDQLLDVLPALRGEADDAEAAPGLRLSFDWELFGDELCLGF
jgi:hypothetical protein